MLRTFKNITLIMFTSLKLAAGAGGVGGTQSRLAIHHVWQEVPRIITAGKGGLPTPLLYEVFWS